MTGPFFVDTDILVYADDARDPRKQTIARELIRRLLTERNGKLSLQVLQEFFSAATGKLGIPAVDVRRRIEIYASMDVVRLDTDDVLAAIDLHRLHELSIWDALVVRAALIAGCRTLYTDDLRHGRRFEALQVVDPFEFENMNVEQARQLLAKPLAGDFGFAEYRQQLHLGKSDKCPRRPAGQGARSLGPAALFPRARGRKQHRPIIVDIAIIGDHPAIGDEP